MSFRKILTQFYSSLLKIEVSFTSTPLIVFRCDDALSKSEELIKNCHLLCKNTKYKRHPKTEEAPHRSDCLTAICYLFRNAIDRPLDWIGNMPRRLSQKRNWRYLKIFPRELELGDLVFLKHKKSPRLITHVAMALGPEILFHCSREKKGASIEKIDQVFSRYTQPSDIKAMLTYVDPRTKVPNRFTDGYHPVQEHRKDGIVLLAHKRHLRYAETRV
jgi:hypothetical protein